jgi:arylsulfatase
MNKYSAELAGASVYHHLIWNEILAILTTMMVCERRVILTAFALFIAMLVSLPIKVALTMLEPPGDYMRVNVGVPLEEFMLSQGGHVFADLGTGQVPVPNEKTSTTKPTKPLKPLNILILYPDDWRHDSLGSADPHKVVQTPFLDRMAQMGMRFTHNCVTTSICWISRATMLTGQYVSRHLSIRLETPPFYFNNTFPALLQRLGGYYTGHIGKWQFHDYAFVSRQYNYTSLFEGSHWEDGVHTTIMAENRTIAFLRNRPKDSPFLLTVAFYAPKAVGEQEQFFPMNDTVSRLFQNITIPPPLDSVTSNLAWERLPKFFTEKNEGRKRYHHRWDTPEKYQRLMKNYYRLIYEVDRSCESIWKELERQGILDETMVIFTTDNGFFHGEHGLAGKWYPFQESIRVPLIVWDPRMPPTKRSTLDDSYTLNVDLATTVLGAAQIPPHPSMQGQNIADLYLEHRLAGDIKPNGTSGGPWRTEFFYEHPRVSRPNNIPQSTALVRKDFKYMAWPQWNVEQLFDLRNDPLEQNDIFANPAYADLVLEMRKRHDELQEQAK